MFFLHQFEITIGHLKLKSIHSLNVRSSWRELTDTAEIVLPRNLNYKEKRLDKAISRGDSVVIKVGYEGGEMRTEFEGYVREVEPNVPIKISCEDEMMKLKSGKITGRWTSLKDILKDIAPSYASKSEEAFFVYACKDLSPAQILLDIRAFGIYSYFKRIDGVMTLVSAFCYGLLDPSKRTIIHVQKNVKKNDLKFISSTNYKLQVKAISNRMNGSKISEYYPLQRDPSADLITMPYGEINKDEELTKVQLRAFAKSEYDRYKQDGYRGSVTLFTIPVVKHGDHIKIIDAKYPEREGTFIVDSTILESSEPYVQRVCELGPRVSVQ